MDFRQAIAARRSIRAFTDAPVPRGDIETILRAAALAPSGKNAQPWRFAVVGIDKREEMIAAMREGLERNERHPDVAGLPSIALRGAWHTLSIMRQAPVTIFVGNALGKPCGEPLAHFAERVSEIVNVQSVGAAIEHMCLAATDLGLGSLWICDTFFAYDELARWLNVPWQMVAAVSIGHAAESPAPRPRAALEELTTWL